MLKRIIIILSTIACLASCWKTNMPNSENLLSSIPSALDTSTIAILPYDTTDSWVFKDVKLTSLTNNDLEFIETTLTVAWKEYVLAEEKKLEEFNAKHPEYRLKHHKEEFAIDLKKYKRQYIAILDNNGEKEVWVNCFCAFTGESWKKEIVFVDDGGACYFNLRINLTTRKYYDFMVNGLG